MQIPSSSPYSTSPNSATLRRFLPPSTDFDPTPMRAGYNRVPRARLVCNLSHCFLSSFKARRCIFLFPGQGKNANFWLICCFVDVGTVVAQMLFYISVS